ELIAMVGFFGGPVASFDDGSNLQVLAFLTMAAGGEGRR
ncbi:hypothetical protein A2U01_0119200, partial [Trifolium medium]|nr:hypothetical protein [Trifolium medium]